MITPTRFEFELARSLGMTHAELGARMGAAELEQWKALIKAEADEAAPKGKKTTGG